VPAHRTTQQGGHQMSDQLIDTILITAMVGIAFIANYSYMMA
jgi:hypothetical protein